MYWCVEICLLHRFMFMTTFKTLNIETTNNNGTEIVVTTIEKTINVNT